MHNDIKIFLQFIYKHDMKIGGYEIVMQWYQYEYNQYDTSGYI
jgi:hypothetical protein